MSDVKWCWCEVCLFHLEKMWEVSAFQPSKQYYCSLPSSHNHQGAGWCLLQQFLDSYYWVFCQTQDVSRHSKLRKLSCAAILLTVFPISFKIDTSGTMVTTVLVQCWVLLNLVAPIYPVYFIWYGQMYFGVYLI